jgi:hypothetical protein
MQSKLSFHLFRCKQESGSASLVVKTVRMRGRKRPILFLSIKCDDMDGKVTSFTSPKWKNTKRSQKASHDERFVYENTPVSSMNSLGSSALVPSKGT